MGVGGAVGGGLGGVVEGHPKTSKASCPREKLEAGWFDASEITTPYTPYVAAIEITLDGKPVRARAVYAPSDNVSEGSIVSGFLTRPKEFEWAAAAIAKADAALVDELGKQLAAPASPAPASGGPGA